MSGINQIQMSFLPLEDRLLFRLNTQDSSSFQFWLTRRYVKLLWPVLMSMLIKDEQIAVQQSDAAKKQVLSFQHEQATQKMDYTQNFKEEPGTQPLGNEPILLSKISIKNRPDGAQLLSIQPEEGQGIDLALDQTLLHSITKLLQDTVAKTDWDIDFNQSLSTNVSPEVPESRALN